MTIIKSIKNIYHYLISHLGRAIYDNPSRDIFVIGVTGTKGKTTVVELINAGLEEAGYKTALNSSIRQKIGDVSKPGLGNSMPGRMRLHKFLRRAVDAKCQFAVIEVTSEGVAQHRHRGIDFDAGIFINLHPEHIESHGTFENYKRAKVSFFEYINKRSRKARKYFFANLSDPHFKDFVKVAGKGEISLFYKSATKSNMAGEFNKVNVAAAEAILRKIGIQSDVIEKAFANFKGVPGRMEKVWDKPEIYVDYAHTPDSLEAVYKSASQDGMKKLICVLGSAGGGRDRWKRPKFGEIASEYCKEIILTDEDPFDENPSQILSEIEFGISKSKIQNPKGGIQLHKILDRREAIKKAIDEAYKNDVIVITGKGSEEYIRVAKGKKIPWSDKAVVLELLGS